MKTLTFIRHAESVSNAGGTTMPHEAIPLSALGHLQARELAATLTVEPSAIWMSGMARTHQTAAPFCERFGIAPQVHAGLNEFSVIDPVLIEGLDGSQRKPLVNAYWDTPNPQRRYGDKADTFAEFDARVTSFIAQMNDLADNAVIFGHGIWFALLMWHLLGYQAYDAKDMRAFRRFQLALPMPNCAVFSLHEHGGKWAVHADTIMAERIAAVESAATA
ncbi:histidine phosphatase family protein [Laribacter hongkongensis]|nr:histidine phosphatase family protein [Laribacter hongkongensis]